MVVARHEVDGRWAWDWQGEGKRSQSKARYARGWRGEAEAKL